MMIIKSFTHFDLLMPEQKDKDGKENVEKVSVKPLIQHIEQLGTQPPPDNQFIAQEPVQQSNKLNILHFKNAKFLDVLYRATKSEIFKRDKCLVKDILIYLRAIEQYRRGNLSMESDMGIGFDELIQFVTDELSDAIKEADENFQKHNLYNVLTIWRVFENSSICVKSTFARCVDSKHDDKHDSTHDDKHDSKPAMSKSEVIFNQQISGYLLISAEYEMVGKLFAAMCYALTIEQIGIKNGRLLKLKKKIMIPCGKEINEYNKITDLSIIPIERLQEDVRKSILRRLGSRGQIFKHIYPELKTCHYKGYGWTVDRWSISSELNIDHTMQMDSDIIIDSEYFQKSNKHFDGNSGGLLGLDLKGMFDLGPSQQIMEDISTTVITHTDSTFLESNHMLCCVPRVNAYNPSIGKWVVVFSDGIILNQTDHGANDCLKNLIIPPIYTKMVTKIIGNHINTTITKTHNTIQENAILTVGHGNRTFLLHGPPGTGKTLTALLIGRYFKTPVLNIKIGDIYGGRAELFEENLGEQFELAKRWNAIILLDEADVLMRKRTVKESMNDNVIVAVFLKKIETYSGVVFLTANSIESIDSAFLSRMTLVIKYENPKSDQRRRLCEIITDELKLEISSDLLVHVWTKEITGRDILNVLRNYKAIKSSVDITDVMITDVMIPDSAHPEIEIQTSDTKVHDQHSDEDRYAESDIGIITFLLDSLQVSS